MKDFDILNAIGDADSELVERAKSSTGSKHIRRLATVVLVAAELAAVVFLFIAIPHMGKRPDPYGAANASGAPTATSDVSAGPLSTPAETPSPEPTETPSSVPTETPSPEPTETPLPPPPSEEWLLGKAWIVADAANEVNGLRFDLGTAETVIGESDCSVLFNSGDEVVLSVHFRPVDSEWRMSGSAIGPIGEMDPNVVYDDLVIRPGETVEVTGAEIAGSYSSSGMYSRFLAAARIAAGKKLRLFETRPENSVHHCIEARAGDPYLYAYPVMDDTPVLVKTALYFRPSHMIDFLEEYMDVGCHVAGPDSPYPGWIAFDIPMAASVTQGFDGMRCTLGFPSDGGMDSGYIYPDYDAMGYIIFISGEILAGADADFAEAYGQWLIRMLYGMDWNEFAKHYSIDDWERICNAIKPAAVSSEPYVRQVDLDKHLMLGCRSAPQAYWNGLFILLSEQCRDDELRLEFDRALDSLTEWERADVNAIMASGN